ncbi:MAG: hypothetical protein J6R21_06940 [Bacteroidales bacterium]|nr:hypothetical protein [Bacteroidales bacterium]
MALLNVSLNLLSGNSFIKAAGDVKVFNNSLGKTEGILDQISQKEQRLKKIQLLSGYSTLISGFTSGVKSAVAGIENVISAVEGVATEGDRIAKTSRLVGMSVKDYQAFDQAARHAGMSTEEMDNALKRFNVNLGKARAGDAKSFKVFDAILGGKNISDFKDSTSLLAAIADGYEKLGSAEQKAMVSQELFGKSGLKMSELLKNGGEDLKKQLESAIPGFSDQGAKDAEAFSDALQDMRGTIKSIKISVMEDLFPVFTDLFGTVKGYIKDNGPKIKEQIGFVVGKVVDFVKGVLPYIPKVLNVVVGLVDLIGPGTLAILGGFTAIFGAVLPLIPALGAISTVVSGPILLGIGAAVVGVIAWKKAITSVIDNFYMLKSFIVDDVWGAIKDFGGQFVEVAKWMWGGFKSVFVDPWWNFFTAFPGAISDLWDGFKAGVSEIGDSLYDTFVGSVKSAVSGIKSVVKGIPILGNLFGDSDEDRASLRNVSSPSASGVQSLGASVARSVSESRTTTTSRFAVDFKNMPRGVQVTAPEHGDFDWSRGYVLEGV